jgi:DNA replication protein DnaC
VIDDWVMAPLAEPERRDFREISEGRYQVRSTILTSQLPVSRWHEQIGDPTLADGILDRLVTKGDGCTFHGVAIKTNTARKLVRVSPWMSAGVRRPVCHCAVCF